MEDIQKYLTEQQSLFSAIQYAKSETEQSPQESLQRALDGVKLARKLHDKKLEIEFSHIIGNNYRLQGQFKESFQYYTPALQIAQELSDTYFIVKSHLGLGAVYQGLNNYEKALQHYFKGLQYDVEELKGNLFNNIAVIYRYQKDYDKAINALHSSLKLQRKYYANDRIPVILLNIGNVHLNKKDYNQAQKYYQESLEISKEYNKHCEAIALSNMGLIHHHKKQYEKAIVYYEDSRVLCNILGYTILSTMNTGKIADSKKLQEKYTEALDLFHEALKEARNNEFDHLVISYLDSIQRIHKQLGNYKKAYEYLAQLKEFQQTLNDKEENTKLFNLMEEKEAEIDVLKEKNNKIAQHNAELRQFAQIVAHDLKEPLRTIASFSNLIHRRYHEKLDDNGKEFIDFILGGTKHMNNLLDGLLQYVTLENKSKQVEWIELKKVVMKIKENSSLLIQETNAQINFNDLPIIQAYPIPIMQLFQNLILNAIKFRRGINPIIDIDVKYIADYYLFSVKDNGIGIDEAYQKKIFKIFNRLDKQKYKGTGIGLAICKKVAELHKGEIWVESSTLNEGSTFCFTIKNVIE